MSSSFISEIFNISKPFLVFDISELNLLLKELMLRWAIIILFEFSLRTKLKLLAYFEEDLDWQSAVKILLLAHLYSFQLNKLATCLTKV